MKASFESALRKKGNVHASPPKIRYIPEEEAGRR